jgi:hypothetical protein
VSRLSRQCEILNISQPYRPPRPITGIALLFFFLLLSLHPDLLRLALNIALIIQSSLVFIQCFSWSTGTPESSRRLRKGNVKASYGVCKIKKRIPFFSNLHTPLDVFAYSRGYAYPMLNTTDRGNHLAGYPIQPTSQLLIQPAIQCCSALEYFTARAHSTRPAPLTGTLSATLPAKNSATVTLSYPPKH